MKQIIRFFFPGLTQEVEFLEKHSAALAEVIKIYEAPLDLTPKTPIQ